MSCTIRRPKGRRAESVKHHGSRHSVGKSRFWRCSSWFLHPFERPVKRMSAAGTRPGDLDLDLEIQITSTNPPSPHKKSPGQQVGASSIQNEKFSIRHASDRDNEYDAVDQHRGPAAYDDPPRIRCNCPRTTPLDCRLQKRAYGWQCGQETSDHG